MRAMMMLTGIMRTTRMQKKATLIFALAVTLPVLAEIEPETLTVDTFNDAGPHGILVNSLFSNVAEIYDADSGKMMGQISLGIGSNSVEIDKRNKLFHVAETYLSRHTRGERTDVVTSYEFETLSAIMEVRIPNKHASGMPHSSYAGITDDARFMLVNNISPALSVSVVDLQQSEFIVEIATAGCGLVYPTGDQAFLQLCGDGSVQLISLNKDGTEKSRIRSNHFFNVEKDPIIEKAARTGKGWVFTTFSGELFRVSTQDDSVAVEPLFNLDAKKEGWRIGGLQSIAYHAGEDLLITLMHEGGEHSHKDPGTEVWVYDLSAKRLSKKIKLENMATAIAMSQDDNPLVYSTFIGGTLLDIYELSTGSKIRSIENLGASPTIIQNLQL